MPQSKLVYGVAEAMNALLARLIKIILQTTQASIFILLPKWEIELYNLKPKAIMKNWAALCTMDYHSALGTVFLSQKLHIIMYLQKDRERGIAGERSTYAILNPTR